MTDDVMDYPYPLDLRWSHIEWFPLFFRRLAASDVWTTADMEVRGAIMSLFVRAMDYVPPATLPNDPAHIAHLVGVTADHWAELINRPTPPLAGWRLVRCGDEIRLTHPMLLDALEVAVKAAKLRQRGTKRRAMWTPPDAGRAPG